MYSCKNSSTIVPAYKELGQIYEQRDCQFAHCTKRTRCLHQCTHVNSNTHIVLPHKALGQLCYWRVIILHTIHCFAHHASSITYLYYIYTYLSALCIKLYTFQSTCALHNTLYIYKLFTLYIALHTTHNQEQSACLQLTLPSSLLFITSHINCKFWALCISISIIFPSTLQIFTRILHCFLQNAYLFILHTLPFIAKHIVLNLFHRT